MRNELPHIESNTAGLLFFLFGGVIGAAVGLGFFFATGASEPVYTFAIVGGFFMSTIWISFLVGRYNRRQRVLYSRERRRAHGLRSPWGEKRTEAAEPYTDRLAHFLAHSIETRSKQGSAEQVPVSSRTTFWSIIDLPQDVTEPKPTKYLRYLLLRIQAAVRGLQR